LKSVADNIDKYLATAAEMLMAEGMTEAADLLRTTGHKVEETGYDNWNGGTTIWTIYLTVEPTEYVALGSKRETLEDQIDTRLKEILEQFTQDWFGVKITPKVQTLPDWRHAKGDLSREVRQNIIDGLKLENVHWSGRLEEVEFLQRLYDLKTLPSTDGPSRTPQGIYGNTGSTIRWIGTTTGFTAIVASHCLMARRTRSFASSLRWFIPSCDPIAMKS
jgi:AbiJ N-terminal domain 3